MYQFEETGGATYGRVNASWPFAKLKVTKDKLELNLSLFGNLQFRPADVTSIVPSSNRSFSRGIRINHTVKGYKSIVVFKSFTNTAEFLRKIDETGFLANKEPLSVYDDIAITTMQATGGFAMKTSATIAIVAIWNILFLPDIIGLLKTGGKINPLHFFLGAKLALGFMVSLCAALIVSEPVRNLVLKEGRTFNDIKIFVYFLMLITTMMLVMYIIVPLQFPH
ncbi:hypothetical protein SAMN05216464_11742 [Mucilaginibacter pineti]|uniref:Uncharacterized protein n=1 Tax=Mucilaginibacter pineti TaxID=1391627 RepID=A0A1G7KQJ7_9SPHI|nr:hypothetical protein [Mucilaginibacter pineti]SDF39366.1 hypothetical protein SAMN05216464_11742 [Mucilaginibacter pineti]